MLTLVALAAALAGAPALALTVLPVITTLGNMAGDDLYTWSNNVYKIRMAYKGIRYAQPPVGKLRFKDPVPAKPWDGLMLARYDGPPCHQPGARVYGTPSEDCLFLNVYSCLGLGMRTTPVIVFFHPGGWFSGTSRSDLYGAEYLLEHEVTLVTVNYRLGPLGFMSTGDEHSVGNYGLKDQVLALKWVRDNIASFRGDPNNITIAGYGVGSTSVQLHMMSPMSQGLFHRVIAMSGGVTRPWVLPGDPLELTKRMADLVGCSNLTNNAELVHCLRLVPAEKLQATYNQMKDWADEPMMVFGPTVEPDIRGKAGQRFMIDQPINLIRQRKFAPVPMVMGITKNEFDSAYEWFLSKETSIRDINTDFERIAPIAFSYERGTVKSKEFSKRLRYSYLGTGEVTNTTKEFGHIYSDAWISQSQEQSAKLFAKYSSAPVYFYFTTYVGRFSHDVDQVTKKPLGVSHHDDLMYLFYIRKRFPNIFNMTDPEAKMVKRLTSFWANFATNGDPTPDEAGLKWKPMTSNNLQYLEIGDDLSMKRGLPYQERMAVWERMFPTSLHE